MIIYKLDYQKNTHLATFMTNLHRRFIYSAFIIFFIIATPLILLYASGYRYNFKKNTLQKTGIVFLETEPERVNIFFNGKIINDKKTPAHIKNLLPNEYNLRIAKDGYTTWEKSIAVREGQTTDIQYIKLFKSNPEPILLLSHNITSLVQGDKKDKVIITYLNTNNKYIASIYTPNDNSEKIIFTSEQPILKTHFIDNETGIAIYTEDNIYLSYLNGQSPISLKQIFNRSLPTNLQLDKFNSNYFYYLYNGNIYKFNRSTKEDMLVVEGQIQSFTQYNDYLYFINNSSLNKSWISKTNLNNSEDTQQLFSIDVSSNYQLAEARDDLVLLWENGKDIIIWNESDKTKETLNNVNYYHWNENQELLFGSDSEIWIYNPKAEEEKFILITRTSDSITEAIWYSVDTHLFYLVDNQIKATENLTIDRFINNISDADLIDDFVINKKGDVLYFIGTHEGENGLYQIEIQ